ncbi:MFS general substrate transporter [Meredithblackwellia eburnea MCA 4105]
MNSSVEAFPLPSPARTLSDSLSDSTVGESTTSGLDTSLPKLLTSSSVDEGAAEKGRLESLDTRPDADGVRFENGQYIVGFNGPDDSSLPINMSTMKKWVIICTISSASFCVTCGSSMVASSYAGVEKDFGVSEEVATLGISLFVLGLGLAPVVMGPMSEFFGRSPIYNYSYVFYFATNMLVAFAPNIGAWISGRFLGGLAGAAFLAVAGGSISDVFAPEEIGFPMAVYTVSPFLGPVAGPIISGFINQHLHWRWTWWVLAIWIFFELVALLLSVPETYEPALLVKRAKKLRKAGRTNVHAPLELDERSVPLVILTSCAKPFELLATEIMALLLCLWTALLLGILYLFFGAFPIVYSAHGFNLQSIGLSFLGIGIGLVLGTLSFPFWDRIYQKILRETGQRPPPEEHLRRGVAGGTIIPICLFWFAWTTQPSVHWIASEIATVPLGIGLAWAFQSVFSYLVDAYRPIAASAMAANGALRSCYAAIFPLFTRQMFDKLGTQWALSLCAFLCLAMAPFPYFFFVYGAKFRGNSKFAQHP